MCFRLSSPADIKALLVNVSLRSGSFRAKAVIVAANRINSFVNRCAAILFAIDAHASRFQAPRDRRRNGTRGFGLGCSRSFLLKTSRNAFSNSHEENRHVMDQALR